MFTSLENGPGLDIVIWLQDHGNALFDLLARLLDIAGGSVFILLVGPLIIWSIHKRTGQNMFILLLIGVLVSSTAKQITDTPRPYTAHPDQVEALFEEAGSGMPSGHVIHALALWFPAVMAIKDRRWAWLLAGYTLLMAWSRMYAGVHYPQDVITGALIGGGLLILYAHRPIEADDLTTPGVLAGLTLLLVALIPFFWSNENGLTLIGAFLGMIWALWVDRRFLHMTVDGRWEQRALRYAVGLIVILALFSGLRFLFERAEPAAIFRVIRYGLTTWCALAGWPWAWQKLGL